MDTPGNPDQASWYAANARYAPDGMVFHVLDRGAGRMRLVWKGADFGKEKDSYLLAVTRYIHLNPIKIAACRRLSKADRMRRLDAYRWSSYPGYVAKRNAQEFVCYDVLREYGSTLAAARRHYRGYVRACVEEDDQPLLDAMRASRYAVGDGSFVAKTEQRIAAFRTGSIRDQDLILPVIRTDLDTVDACVAKQFGMDTADLKQHGRRAGPAKAVAVELACRLTGQSGREVGMHYGGISGAAVGNIRRKVREGTIDVLSTVERMVSQLQTPDARTRKV